MKKFITFLMLISTASTLAYSYKEIGIKIDGDNVREVRLGQTCYGKDLTISSLSIMETLTNLNDGIYACSGDFSDDSDSPYIMKVYALDKCRKATKKESEKHCQPWH